MNRKLIEQECEKMVRAFSEDFFIPYIEKINDKGKEATGIVLNFACSAFLSVVVPILLSGTSSKKAIDDANAILNDMRSIIQKKIKQNGMDKETIN